MSNEARTRVLKGAALLDARPSKVPADWRVKIDLDSLDLGSVQYCILGQLFDGYDNGLDALGLRDNDTVATDHGFVSGYGTIDEWVSSAELGQAWKNYLSTPDNRITGKLYRSPSGYVHKVVAWNKHNLEYIYTLERGVGREEFIPLSPAGFMAVTADEFDEWKPFTPAPKFDKGDVLNDQHGNFYFVESPTKIWRLRKDHGNTHGTPKVWADGGVEFTQTLAAGEVMSKALKL